MKGFKKQIERNSIEERRKSIFKQEGYHCAIRKGN